MDIFSRDYRRNEDNIITQINQSDFISLSLKVTGLEEEENNFLLDTPEERYLKYKLTSEKYSIIQLSIAIFKAKEEKDQSNKILYDCYPYNLYLFPNSKDLKELSQDNMNLEIKLLENNRNNNINFNKWINGGIPYLNDKQYRQLYKQITENNINNDNYYIDINNLKPLDLELANKTIEDIQNNYIKYGKIYEINYMIQVLPKYILYYIKKHLPYNIYFQENYRMFGNWFTLLKGYRTKEEKEKLYKEDIITQLRELDYKKGAKRIFDEIFNKIYYSINDIDKRSFKPTNKKKKVLVGHNMSLDLLFMFSKFGETLPDNYQCFKEMIKNDLDCIYDTKLIFEELKKEEKYKNSIGELRSELKHIYDYLKLKYENYLKVDIKLRNYEKPKQDENFYSGYDSYINGLCFLYLYNFMNENNFIENNRNKIFFKNSLYKCFDLNKIKEDFIYDIKCPDDNIFILKNLKKGFENFYKNVYEQNILSQIITNIIYDEKNNLIVIFTNFNNDKNKEISFRNMIYDKKNEFLTFSLSEYRINKNTNKII